MNPLSPAAFLHAGTILGRSRSSFAPAIRLLPREQRQDLATLYAVCRTLDDIADLEHLSPPSRQDAWLAWRDAFTEPAHPQLPPVVRELIQRRGLDCGLFVELLDGVATDLNPPVTMTNRADLDLYCHQVAGTVGRLCLPVFGAANEQSVAYAETLGRALQYTNILRDTAADFARQRLYYPLDELSAAGLDPQNPDRAGWTVYLRRFAAQTGQLYRDAARRVPAQDRRALRPAQLMATLYHALWLKIIRHNGDVFTRRYRLGAWEKIFLTLRWTVRCDSSAQ
jgi:phytoene synthase